MDRADAFISLLSLRFAGAGMSFVLGPRWVRRIMKGFTRMSDTEMRVIGYVLVGAAAVMFAQQVTRRSLSAKIDALAKERALPAREHAAAAA
jgi:uncharacterized protein YjeT (DUF2065 family)